MFTKEAVFILFKRLIIFLFFYLLLLCGCQKNSAKISDDASSKQSVVVNSNDLIDIEPIFLYDDYKIEIDIDPKERILKGTENIKYTNKSETFLNTIFLNVPANFLNKELFSNPNFENDLVKIFYEKKDFGYFDIFDVKVNNRIVDFNLNNQVLEIILNEPIKVNERIDINFTFEGYIPKIKYRYGANDDIIWVSNYLPLVTVLDKYGWHKENIYFIGDPFFSDVANFSVTIKTPNNYSVASTSVNTFIQNETENITTFEEKLLRDFPFVVYDNEKYNSLVINNGSKTEINYFTKIDFENNFEKSLNIKSITKIASETLEYYNYTVGNYPYNQLNIFEIDYYKPLGFSNNQTIFLDSDTINNNFLEKDIINLIGKQWFGMIIGNNSVRYPWISDGLVNLMSEYIINIDENIVDELMLKEYDDLSKRITSIEHSSLLNDLSVYSTDQEYQEIQVNRAKLMFYSLRKKMKYAKFNAFLKQYYKLYNFKIVDKDSLINVAETTYDSSLKEFFNGWLENYVMPQINN